MFVREIPSDDLAILKSAAGLSLGDHLPPKVQQNYWEFKRCGDRIGYCPQPPDLARIAADCGYGKPTKQENAPTTIAQLWKNKELGPDDLVVVHWTDGEKEAHIKRMAGRDEAVVQFIGDDVETPVSVDRIAVPQTAA